MITATAIKTSLSKREAEHFYRKKMEGRQLKYSNVSLYPLIENGITGMEENGEEGVDVFSKEHSRINMVLLDMVIPKKSGKEAFIEMKKIDPNIKVLLSSGFRKDERVEDILILGVKGFIQKPFTIERLTEAVRETIHG